MSSFLELLGNSKSEPNLNSGHPSAGEEFKFLTASREFENKFEASMIASRAPSVLISMNPSSILSRLLFRNFPLPHRHRIMKEQHSQLGAMPRGKLLPLAHESSMSAQYFP
eukprot:TRINITY_DN4362_c0_g1_i1.p1 TRINITY_DN4362_c0_g1~~TRINITY_DN4362_c0_g1_i1.p1  ORF type:complete len:111 (+),score=15.77 TRINITY_DN4362_c0_g1_i1:175-507(+)